MDLARLKRLLEAHGAEPRRWPEGERAAALDLLAGSPAARAALEAAARLDGLLGGVAPEDPVATAALRARIAALAATPARRAAPRGWSGWSIGPWPVRRLWPQAMGLVAAAVIGFVVGIGHPPSPAADGLDPGPDLADLAGLAGGLQP